MELNTNKFASATAVTVALWYVVCALVVGLAPEMAAKLFSWTTHLLNVEGAVSYPEVIYGFVEAVILAYVTAYVFALLYNRFVRAA